MTNKKFDKKIYSKERVYIPLLSYSNISRLWQWDHENGEYRAPTRGKIYLARKYVLEAGERKRTSKYFNDLPEALDWQAASLQQSSPISPQQSELFQDIANRWKDMSYPRLRKGTQYRYDTLLPCLSYFSQIPIQEISSKCIDDWITKIRSENKTTRRKSFNHELTLLQTIFSFYGERTEGYVSPIKKRHKKDIIVQEVNPKPKDLSEEDFWRFTAKLSELKYGSTLTNMAIVQYYHALRISEVAALNVNSINLDTANPNGSTLTICRSVKWDRSTGSKPYIEENFKNSVSNGGVKSHNLFPQSYEALLRASYAIKSEAQGYLFTQADGALFSYRLIQQRYDTAFKNAGLEFSSTHVMRHAGCSRVYNASNGDLNIAKQILGNKDLGSVMVYAHRDQKALAQLTETFWNQSVVADGRNREETN